MKKTSTVYASVDAVMAVIKRRKVPIIDGHYPHHRRNDHGNGRTRRYAKMAATDGQNSVHNPTQLRSRKLMRTKKQKQRRQPTGRDMYIVFRGKQIAWFKFGKNNRLDLMDLELDDDVDVNMINEY